MGGNLGRIRNKVGSRLALISILTASTLISPAPLHAETNEQATETQEQTEQKDYWKIIKTAIDGGSVKIEELRKAIEKTAADAKGGRYLDLNSNEYKSNAEDVYSIFSNAWNNKGLQKESRVEFLRGMALVDPKRAAREVENAINDKDKIIAIGAMDAAIYVDTKAAAENILKRIFDEDKDVVNQAYKSLYMMKSTPYALPGVMDREGNAEKIKIYLDIAVNYYLINGDPEMRNILLNRLRNEHKKDIITCIVKSIEKTDILQSKEARDAALTRLVNGQYPELMGEVLIESIKKGRISSDEANKMITKINNQYNSANEKTRGVMNQVLAELYIVKGEELPVDTLTVKTFSDRINSSKNEERIGAIKALGRLLEYVKDENTRTSYLRALLDIYKNEEEKVDVRNAAAEALGRNVFDESVGVLIKQLENSKNVGLREGTAKALYLYNEKEPLTYHISGIEGLTVKEIKRITDEEYREKEGDGSGSVLNYLLIILGKKRYCEKSGTTPNEYRSPNLGVDKNGNLNEKPTKSVVPEEIKKMLESGGEEIKKAYPGLAEYYAWLAKANLLTQAEADNLVSTVNLIYNYAKEKKDYELMKKVAFLCSALGTNYNKTGLVGIVAEILEENYSKNPDVVVYVLRVLRGDLVGSGGKIKGGLASENKIIQVLEKLATLPLTPDEKGERDHLMMLLNRLIFELNFKTIRMGIEQEWPWETKYTAIIDNPNMFWKGVEPLPDKIA
ncbi:MAG: hypothetical protein QXD51_00375 [Candidatus Anstonellales archaeon]